MSLRTSYRLLLATGAAAALTVVPTAAGAAMPGSPGRETAPGHQVPAAAANWPQFGYDVAHTGYNPLETTIGPGNAGSLQPLWSYQTGQGSSFSSVSIESGRVFLGTLDRTLRAWDASTGSLLWSKKLNGGIEDTAAVGDGRVYIETDHDGIYGSLYALSPATGQVLWRRANGGAASSPALAKGVVYVAGFSRTANSETMNAYNARTGSRLWSTTVPGQVVSAPAVAGGRVFVSAEENSLVALNSVNGDLLWSRGIRRGRGVSFAASPIVGDGGVYLCNSAGLHAFWAATGLFRWFTPQGCDEETTAPALAQGVLYTDGAGQTGAFSATTGQLIWSASSGGGNGPPAVANGVLYVTTNAGTIQAFDLVTHALLWTSPPTGSGQSGPAVVNGVLYVGGDNGVSAFAPS